MRSEARGPLESWVETRLGLSFGGEQAVTLRGRLRALAERLGLGSIAELETALLDDPEGMGGMLAEALATHHTGFFREPSVLAYLDQEILPSLARRREPHRLWSAAASSGQEAYSVAILAAERFGHETARQRFAILGTDLVDRVVRLAERGRFRPAEVEGLSSKRRERWFHPVEDDLEITPEIRAMCTFRRLNLMKEPWPFSRRFSVILCRNVLYYFEKDVQSRLIRRMYDAVEPGGWLLTGVSESIRDLGSRWETISSGVHRHGQRSSP